MRFITFVKFFILFQVFCYVLVSSSYFTTYPHPVLQEVPVNWSLSRDTVMTHPWTFITSAFMHGSFIHIFLNMLALFSLAAEGFIPAAYSGSTNVEPRVSPRALILTYCSALVVANIFVLAIPNNLPTLGASGAIFGLFGLVLVHRNTAHIRQGMVIALLINVGITFGIPHVSWQAHAGGLLAGIIAGVYVNWKLTASKRLLIERIFTSPVFEGQCPPEGPSYLLHPLFWSNLGLTRAAKTYAERERIFLERVDAHLDQVEKERGLGPF